MNTIFLFFIFLVGGGGNLCVSLFGDLRTDKAWNLMKRKKIKKDFNEKRCLFRHSTNKYS